MSRRSRPQPNLLDFWPVLRRRQWYFILPAFAAAVLVLVGSLFLPRKYRGEAAFERRTDMVLAEMANRGASNSFQDPRPSMSLELAGKPALDQLVTQLQAPGHPAAKSLAAQGLDAEALRHDLRRKVLVHYEVASAELDRVRVSFISTDPVLARAVVNGLVQNYIDRSKAQIDARLRQSADFFRQEVQRSRALVEELEGRRLTYALRHGAVLPDGGVGMSISVNDMQTQLALLRQQQEEAQARVEALQKALEQTPATQPSYTTGRNPDRVAAEARLQQLRSQLENALGGLKMTPKHPEVIALRQQIAATSEQLAAMPEEVVTQRQVTVNPKKAELELMLTNAAADAKSFGRQVEGLQRELARVAESTAQALPVRSEYLKLTRQISEGERQVAFWEDNLRRVELSLTAESGNRGVQLSFLSPCDAIQRPVSPNLYQVLGLALGLGALVGVGAVLLKQRNDETFLQGEQLAKALNLPVFGQIGEIATAHERRWRSFRQRVLHPLNVAMMVAVLAILAVLLHLSLTNPDGFERFKRQPLQTMLGKLGGGAVP